MFVALSPATFQDTPAQVAHSLSGQQGSPPPAFQTLYDDVPFQKGAYTAFMAPFNVGSLRYHRDYDEKVVVERATFPNDTLISWAYPHDHAASSIKSFLAIDYGNYNHTNATEPIASSMIGRIKTLQLNVALITAGYLEGYDVIVDYYLTSKKGDLDTKITEVEIALHGPSFFKRYADSVRTIGFYKSEDGAVWKISLDEHAAMMQGKPDILIYPTDGFDRLNISLDIQALHRVLVDRNVLNGTEYFNGLALGVEPQQQSGTLTVKTLNVTYQAKY